ncbi:hypothetical protein IQ658_001356 [Salmonella enterica]|nr:hypothetical protein [Salmonella enterica subsp. enterica serovar 4,[5],12:i:-]EGL5264418.1 hypothetical protein [Salmonella enterica]VEA46811.1 Uncharacterised protein [Salmonella enterica subsp. arizonae]
MTQKQHYEALEFKVGFPKENGVRITLGEKLSISETQCIGSDVQVKIGSEIIAKIPYSEDLSEDFTLEGYEERAKSHAVKMTAKIIEATQIRVAKYDASLAISII